MNRFARCVRRLLQRSDLPKVAVRRSNSDVAMQSIGEEQAHVRTLRQLTPSTAPTQIAKMTKDSF